MNTVYARQWMVDVSDEPVNNLLADHEKILRLAPQWDVKDLKIVDYEGETIELNAEYDRSETSVCFTGFVKTSDSPKSLRILLTSPTKSIDLTIAATEGDTGKVMSIRIETSPEPDIHEVREFDLWARSIIDYLRVSGSTRFAVRLWKSFLDRWWLNMTQSGKRITFLVVVSEGFSLVFLLALLLWWKFF